MAEERKTIDRVLVTGGSGFIGTNLVDHLIARGTQVLSVDICEPQNASQRGVFQRVDVLDKDSVDQILAAFKPTHIVHMAAKTDLAGARLQDYSVNYTGVQILLDALAKCDSLERCLFVSSKLVCRTGYQPKSCDDYCPDTIYGQSKAEGEKIVRKSNKLECEWLIGRPTSIWGPWFDVPYRQFFLTVAKSRYFHPGRANPLKSYGYVGNTVHQIIKLLEARKDAVHRKTFYLSDYEPCTIRDWANMISQELHGKCPLTMSESIMRLAAWGGDCLQKIGYKNPPMTSFRLANMRADTTLGVPIGPTKEVCGTLPYSLKDGVAETIVWLRKQHLI